MPKYKHPETGELLNIDTVTDLFENGTIQQ